MSASIGVIYLDRYGNEQRSVTDFQRSLYLNKTGIDFTQVVIRKGYNAELSNKEYADWLAVANRKVEFFNYSDEGYDLTVYQKAARNLDSEFCLFFNSHSRILHPNWLESYVSTLERFGDGALVGATGSWEIPSGQGEFPNVHLRSNAFLLRRKIFLSLEGPTNTRDDCLKYESGSNSMSRQVIAKGGKLVMVSSQGPAIDPHDWPYSKVFRSGDQEHLLVADNRTQDYQLASSKRRKKLAQLAWGDIKFASNQNSIQFLLASVRRKYSRWRL